MSMLRGRRRTLLAIAWSLTASLAATSLATAQEVEREDPEKRVKRMRQGAGLRGGAWWVQDLPEVSDAEYSQTPAFEGYFQKGLDLHLAIETTLGLWRRSQELEETGALGTTRQEVQSYVIPSFTSIKLYPFTRPDAGAEPYVSGGIGIALGIDDRSGEDLLGVGSGTALITGFGFKAGLGLDWRFSRAFGLTAGGRYTWLRFSEELGGARTYRGFGLDLGLTYRFQYE